MSSSAGRGSLTCTVVRTWRARRARWADRAALQLRQRTTSLPSGRPPRATSRTWSAVRSAEGWAERRSHPGHQSPTMARWSATTRRLRSRSLASLWRSGRRCRLAWSWPRWQSTQRGLPRTGLPHPRQGRSRLWLIGVCGACVGVAPAGRRGSGRRTGRGVRSGRRIWVVSVGLRLGRRRRVCSYPWRWRRVRRTGVWRPC
jgi:hypothetical protein